MRGDVADIALAGILFAPHYATPQVCQCGTAPAMMRDGGTESARAVSQLLPGEAFAVLESVGGWAWGYSLHDHYVGYVPASALAAGSDVDHAVIALCAPVFSAPDIKAPVAAWLTVGSHFAGNQQDDWVRTATGYVHARHAVPVAGLEDWVGFAEQMIGLPYLWGGRGAGGIDCSGLVQLALGLAGLPCPRDSDQQRALGDEIEGELTRGDLAFFPGHVGIMLDETRLLHANAHWMGVVAEPLADAIARLPGGAGDILARRRLA